MPYQNKIEVLEGLEAVRRNVAMWVGPPDGAGIMNVLVQEALCMALDDAASGKCTQICVSVSDSHRVTVRHDGPGLPMQDKPFGVPAAQLLFTQLLACRQFGANADLKSRCCGVGIAVVNALCDRFCVRNSIDGACWVQEYHHGRPEYPFRRESDAAETGLEISFEPDQTLLTNLQFNRRRFLTWVKATGVEVELERSRRRKGATVREFRFTVCKVGS